jgi:hypothetical protein
MEEKFMDETRLLIVRQGIPNASGRGTYPQDQQVHSFYSWSIMGAFAILSLLKIFF